MGVSAWVGAAVVAGFALVAILAPALAPHDPLEITRDRLASPSFSHPLGTDVLGRDLLSRVIHGARASMGAAALAGVLVITIGVGVGTAAGVFGGWIDAVLMRLVDVLLALPGLVIAFAIAGLVEPSLWAVLLGLVSVWWVSYARIVRTLVIGVKDKAYISAARSAGAGRWRLIRRHVLPNVAPSIVVLATLRMGRLLLAIAGLSFLGLGAQPPTPEWGAMLNEARPAFPSFPHAFLAPGLAITGLVLGINLLGEGLRDALDPRMTPS
ncbi:MAG: ABC transporter permease [Acidimicrobiales bacterium]